MGLFKTTIVADDAEKKPEIPTIIELCAKAPMLAESNVPSFAPIHYSATQTDLVETKNGGLRAIKQEIIPDLGIWSIPCKPGMVDALIPKDPTVFVMSIDLTKIPFNEVEPCVNQQQQALIRHLIQHPREESQEIASTSLELLKTSQFGLATEDVSTNAESKPREESPEDKTNVVTLQICVKIPPRSDDVTEQQKLSFVIYHFHKFALSTKASLLFVSEEEPQATLSSIYSKDVSAAWKGLAQGKRVWEMKTFHEETPTTEEDDTILVYGPDSQSELLESVWQRNASAPGQWDAAKDSMWIVFPQESNAANPAAIPKIPPGDEGWLSELRDSMANITATTVKTPQKETAKVNNDTPGDKDVSSFFKDLMNN